MTRPLLCFALLLASLTACSPARQWGNEARYAPEFRGYVLVQSPDTRARLVLRNPITRSKIRCREALDPYLGPITLEGASQVHDENTSIATLPITAGLLLPASGSGMLFLMGGIALSAPPDGLSWILSSPSADSLYDRGKRALDESRFAEAERLFELALAKRGGDVEVQRASYFLGELYERAGRPRAASRAFREFVDRAGIRDEKAYDEAERRLVAQGATPPAPCRSQAPVTFTWPRHR